MKGHTRDILHLVLNMEARIENTDFKISIENALSQIAFYQHEIQMFFFLTALWTYNSHTIQFTHLKYVIQFLVYSQSCATIIIVN